MFKPTNPQTSLFELQPHLPSRTRKQLERSWASSFRVLVLPVLFAVEADFSDLYGAKGRPNWSVARMLGITVLQEWFKLTDQQAMDALMFDMRWPYALGLEPEDAMLSRRSIVEFRSRLVAVDPEMTRLRRVFDLVAAEAIESLGVSVEYQRIDSTLVCSNIQSRGRVYLFRRTVIHCLRSLTDLQRARLSDDLQGLLIDKEDSWFAAPSGEIARVQLEQYLAYAVEIREAFKSVTQVTALEAYQLVCRLVDEQSIEKEVTDKNGSGDSGSSHDGATTEPGGHRQKSQGTRSKSTPKKRVLKSPKKIPGDSMSSPFDPDAGYGHKGLGYMVHSAETCGNLVEILTDIAVVSGEVPDITQSTPALIRLDGVGLKPTRMYADGGYASGKTVHEAAQLGVQLHAPVNGGALPQNHLGREAFVFDDATGEILQCPAGHVPLRHSLRKPQDKGPPRAHAYFPRAVCETCPFVETCAARPGNSGKGSYWIDTAPHLKVRDEALATQRNDPLWWHEYRIRSGVEATQSELKRAHGLGKLKVRGTARVRLAAIAKFIACNVKRWIRGIELRGLVGPGGPQPDSPPPAGQGATGARSDAAAEVWPLGSLDRFHRWLSRIIRWFGALRPQGQPHRPLLSAA